VGRGDDRLLQGPGRPVNLNFRYVAPELRYVVDNADLAVLVYERALSGLVSGLVSEAFAPVDEGSGGPVRVGGRVSDLFVVIEDGTPPAPKPCQQWGCKQWSTSRHWPIRRMGETSTALP
jgi:hypothetical protein